MYFNIIPIICTTTNKSDTSLITLAKKYRINIFRGSEKNKLNRWYNCAKKFKLKFFHTVDADDPYFDPVTIKKSLQQCKKKFDIVYPSKISQNGGASEGYSFSLDSITKLNQIISKKFKNTDSLDTEMIEKFINKKEFNIKEFKGSSYELKKLRLTLDYIEDYNMIKKIYEVLGSFPSRSKVNTYLKKNNNIIKINYFRKKDWKIKQNISLKR